MSRTTRLEDAFEVDGDEMKDIERDEMEEYAVKIPEIRNLELISQLALDAYEVIWNSMHLFDPRDRTEQIKIAKTYLSEAKDAIHKRDVLIQKAKQGGKSDDAGKTGETVPGRGYSRDELEKRRKEMMKQ